jgi:thymidylate kinase
MLIQIEGNEASGKTTLINTLSTLIKHNNLLNKYNYQSIHLPSKHTHFGKICQQLLKGDVSYLYLLADLVNLTNKPISKEIIITLCAYLDQYIVNNNIPLDTISIQSRGVLSNLVYSDLSSLDLSNNFTQYILPLITLLPKPDLIIYLKADSNSLRHRLTNRLEPKKIYDDVKLLDIINARYEKVIKLFPSWNIHTLNALDSIQINAQATINLITELN